MAVPLWCTLDKCPLEWGYVHYQPSVPGNSVMLAAFGALLAPALYLGVKKKVKLFTGIFIMGLLGEIAGYIGRIMLHGNPFKDSYFMLYLICTTIAPVFTVGAVYLTLARIVVVYGEEISRIRPRTYTLIFSGMDLIALIIQAVGGGLAAVAWTQPKIDEGTHIMVAGLAFQVFCMLCFMVLAIEFAWRVRNYRGQRNSKYTDVYKAPRFKRFLCALAFATVCLFIRTVFRCAELSGGFAGDLAQHQVDFMILDGVMVLLACISLMGFHPGVAFGGSWNQASFRWGAEKPTPDSDVDTMTIVQGSNKA